MTTYPVAASIETALLPNAPQARTAQAAGRLAGGPVFLAAETLGRAFADIKDAEAALPGLYGDGRFELIWQEGAWRAVVRFWRPAPPAPIARSAEAAVRRPIGSARTPDEALAVLGAPAELVTEPLPRLYRTTGRARARWKEYFDGGLASLEERDGGYAVLLTFWRPIRGKELTQTERDALAARSAAPLRPTLPQVDPFVGLFERLAPENPAIVLAEEGDGRTRGE